MKKFLLALLLTSVVAFGQLETQTQRFLDMMSNDSVVTNVTFVGQYGFDDVTSTNTLVWSWRPKRIFIDSNATLTASSTGWFDGNSMFCLIDTPVVFSLDTNIIVVGYSSLPVDSMVQAITWTLQGSYFINPIFVSSKF